MTSEEACADLVAPAPPQRQHPMRLADLLNGPWAIVPSHLLEMQAIYETHLRGDKIDVAAIEARLGRPLANEPRSYEVINGVAVLPVEGVISPKANLMTQVSGGASAQLLMRELRAAGADSAVRSVIVAADTPGGNAQMIPDFAQLIAELATTKPVVTWSDGMLASAGYWFGSAANSVWISGPVVQVGSIGVVATHRDVSGAEAKAGIKTTEITAGKYKRIASSNEPLNAAGRASIQAQIDYLYGLFVDAVAGHRGVDVEAVLEHMADGRVFIGQQAIDAGLVDGVSTLEALIENMATDPKRFAARQVAVVKTAAPKRSQRAGVARVEAASTTTSLQGKTMPGSDDDNNQSALTRASLETDHPALFGALRTEFTVQGAQQERNRIKGVREQGMPGQEALIERMSMDGTSTPAEAAMAVNAAQRNALAAAQQALADDAPPAVRSGAAPAEGATGTKTRDQMAAEAKAYAAEHSVTFVAAIKALGYGG